MGVTEEVVQKSGKVLTSGDPADGPGQNVVKHQGRDGDFSESAAHGLLDDAVNAAAHEHAATFHIERTHRVSEEHDGQNEPGRCLAERFLGDGAGIEGRGAHVVEHDCSGPPEGDKAEHGGGGHQNPGNRASGTGRLCKKGICAHLNAGKTALTSVVI